MGFAAAAGTSRHPRGRRHGNFEAVRAESAAKDMSVLQAEKGTQ
jgi:hypothetical protein